MKTLKQYLHDCQHNSTAIAHFNVANSDMLMAVFKGAQNVSEAHGEKIPVIIGVSEGERDAFGLTQIIDYVTSLRNEYDYPIFLNADHTYSVERTCEAIDAGYDMVIYDDAKGSYQENLENTKKVVDYKNEVNPECIVEAEFGFIGGGSNIKDTLPEGVSEATMTKADEAKKFVHETGIDALAPSVGNVHGMVKTGNPALNPQRVREILEATNIPLVLHGGSGSTDEDFVAVIHSGIAAIHISTELRIAFRKGIEDAFTDRDELAPYKYMKQAQANVTAIVEDRIKLFWGI